MGFSSNFGEVARAVAPEMVALRRDLHRYPELGWSEHRTTRKVAERFYARAAEASHSEDDFAAVYTGLD